MTLVLVSLALLLAGGILSLLASRRPRLASLFGAGGAVLGGAVGAVPAIGAVLGGEPQTVTFAWGGYGQLAVGLDPLSGFFLLPMLAVPALAALYGSEARAGRASGGAHWFFFDVLAAGLAGVVVARDGLTFLVAWETMALASFFLVVEENEKPAVRSAGWIYLVATHLGTAFLFPFFLLLGQRAGSPEFGAIAAASANLPAGLAAALFVFALLGFGTKAGLMPLHPWIPEAYPAAPSHVAAVMSGVMSKAGLYGLLRALSFLGPPASWWGPLLLAVGVASGVLGILLALAQHDLKKLVAYSSVESIGVAAIGVGLGLVGISSGQPQLAALGMAGALLHALNDATFKSLLFLAAGAVERATGTRELDRLGGLLKRMPFAGAAFLVGALALCGLPPFNGFVGEFLLYVGAFDAAASPQIPAALCALAAIGGLALIGGLAAATFTKAFGIAFLGEPRADLGREVQDVGARGKVALGLLALACVAVGIFAPHAALFAERAMNPAAAVESPATTSLAGLLFGVTAGAAALWLLGGLLWGLRRALLRGRAVGSAGTWDCGYAEPTARMQYTASSFADPLIRVFIPFLRTRHSLQAPKGFFPDSASLATETPDLGREKVFGPAFALARDQLARLGFLQAGGMHRYVLFIALTLVALLVWKL